MTEDFDAFYADCRERLLLQTFALTGDRGAAQAAVRDAFVQAQHHWRKVSRLADREAWVRPHAWSAAKRRAQARVWHKESGLSAEAAATLDALSGLGRVPRETLLLTTLSTGSLPEIAQEVGVPLAEAERELQTGTAKMSVALGCESTEVRDRILALRGALDGTRWPRARVLERAGVVRRRSHVAAGVLATIATMVGLGTLVTVPGGSATPPLAERTDQPGPAGPGSKPELPAVRDSRLLAADQITRLAPAREWQALPDSDRTGGAGVAFPCLPADVGETGAEGLLVRKYAAAPSGDLPHVAAAEAVQVSRTEQASKRLFNRATMIYGNCQDPRTQLLGAHRVEGVGDDALLLVLRDWRPGKPVPAEPGPDSGDAEQGDKPAGKPAAPPDRVRTTIVGLARTGQVTTVTLSTVDTAAAAKLRPSATMLAAAVNALCGASGTATCAGPPSVVPVTPPTVPGSRGMLTEVDLPPVSGVPESWVGTSPAKATGTEAASPCDATTFSGDAISNNRTRTFVIPDANLPDRFGLSQNVGTLPLGRAKQFVAGVRDEIDKCEDDNLGADVTPLPGRTDGPIEIAAWRIDVEVSDDETVSFVMGVVRNGTAVSQISFVPGDQATIADSAFPALLDRAAERLTALPSPRPTG